MGFFNVFIGRKEQLAVKPSPVETRVVELPDLDPVIVALTINCLGEKCPRPQFLAKRALQKLQKGQVLEVIVENEISVEAIPASVSDLSGRHLTTVRNNKSWYLYFEKVG